MTEVDSFKSKVYESFSKVYNENNILNGRVNELNALIQKYNSDKEAIASTLIYAQSTADKTLSEARQKADEIVAEANERAEREYKDRIAAAESSGVFRKIMTEQKLSLKNILLPIPKISTLRQLTL